MLHMYVIVIQSLVLTSCAFDVALLSLALPLHVYTLRCDLCVLCLHIQ